MVATGQLSVKDGDVLLLVGTMKGLFLFRSGETRKRWEMGGPHFPGLAVYASAYDGRQGRRRLWAAPQSMHWGAELVSSDDFGRRWDQPEVPRLKFPETAGTSLANIWQIAPGPPEESDTLYCGVQTAALFESKDAGKTWALNEGLWNHPHRAKWTPGGGGLCLHTILPDPAGRGRLTVAVSTGGVYRSEDRGRTWTSRNTGVRAEYLPDRYPEFGQCVHKIVHHASRPDRVFLQNHWGLYRSDDGGDSWKDIARGVPSDFGFCMAIHPRSPDTVFILPIESDGFRCVPEGKLRVYRTSDAGKSWKPLSRGLPQKDAFETVLRDAMSLDGLDPAGIYFGTRSGKVFASRDEGRTWNLVREGLPPVVSVKAAIVSLRPRARRSRRAA